MVRCLNPPESTMPQHKYSRQHPVIGRVAARLLTIPVMAIALVVGYVALRMVHAEPTVMADMSNGRHAAPVVPGLLPIAAAADGIDQIEQAPTAREEVSDAHDDLDPVGAGRSLSPGS